MKLNNQNNIGDLIVLFDNDYLNNQKIAGQCVKKCLQQCEVYLKNNKNITSHDLEAEVCLPIFMEFNCWPTFLNYQPKGKAPFPASICVSINNELVHGIPKNQKINSGDVVKVDLGATYKGAIADAAKSFIFGEPKKQEHVDMLALCEKVLDEAIKNIKIGNKIGSIGYTIHKIVKNSQFRVITDYGGHGISYDFENKKGIPHAAPFICNKAQLNEGPTIMPGMTFAIEPLLVKGDNRTRVGTDGWTVLVDSEISAHYEHTLFITDNGVEVIT